jgi:hypothetical protein
VEQPKKSEWRKRHPQIQKPGMIALIIVLVVVAATAITACGDSSNSETASSTTETIEQENATTTTAASTTTNGGTTGTTTVPTTPTTIAPIVYSGSGDAVVTVEKPIGMMVAYIEGNAAGGQFTITSYNPDGIQLDILVDTAEKYRGVRTVDGTGTMTAKLEVKASGEWTVEFRAVESVKTLAAGDTYSGNGDDVFILGKGSTSAMIRGNAIGRHFTVIRHTGQSPTLLVNTADPYDGQVMVDGGGVVEVKAVGDWTYTAEK